MTEEHYTAYHEAGHAAADLVLGHQSMLVTIEPRGTTAGRALDFERDDITPDGIQNLIVAYYAGAEAQRQAGADPRTVDLVSGRDYAEAEALLPRSGSTEPMLRGKAAQLVREHWGLVELIASDLIQYRTLEYEEVGLIYEIYRGDASHEDLARYRLMCAEDLARQREFVVTFEVLAKVLARRAGPNVGRLHPP